MGSTEGQDYICWRFCSSIEAVQVRDSRHCQQIIVRRSSSPPVVFVIAWRRQGLLRSASERPESIHNSMKVWKIDRGDEVDDSSWLTQ